MDIRAVITGAGLISPLGDSSGSVFDAMCERRSGVRRRPISGQVNGHECHLAACLDDFNPETYLTARPLRPLDRISRMAAASCGLALNCSHWTAENRATVDLSLVMGTMFGGMHTIGEFDRASITSGPATVSPMTFANTVINAAASQTAIWHNLRGSNSTVAAGSVSGISAVGHAAELILQERSTAVLAGGADEFSVESFYAFSRASLLCAGANVDERPIPFDHRRNGFALGEGAGFLVLESLAGARQRGAGVLAEVKGYATAFDVSRGKDPELAGRTIARSIRTAIRRSGLTSDDIDFVSASANGSITNDCYELRAIAAVFADRASSLPVTAIKSATGETLGASGPFQIALAIETLQRGTLPGIIGLEELPPACPLGGVVAQTRSICARNALINGVGVDGNCCSLVIGGLE